MLSSICFWRLSTLQFEVVVDLDKRHRHFTRAPLGTQEHLAELIVLHHLVALHFVREVFRWPSCRQGWP